ncbi:Heat shock protein 90-5, chloroplastic [Trebouxia sp. C0009 RCD-2024]
MIRPLQILGPHPRLQHPRANLPASTTEAQEKGTDTAQPVEPVTLATTKTSQQWQIQNDSKPLWTKFPRGTFVL